MHRVIVSRHRAAVEFIAQHLGTEGVEYVPEYREGLPVAVVGRVRADVDSTFGKPGEEVDRVPVITGEARVEDVEGKIIYGNVPLSLAAWATQVWAIIFTGNPPRGQEYTLGDMERAGAQLVPFVVVQTISPKGEFFQAVREGA